MILCSQSPLVKGASNTRPCSKCGGATLNAWEEMAGGGGGGGGMLYHGHV